MRTLFLDITDFLEEYFGSTQWSSIDAVLKITSIIISILLFAFLMILLFQLRGRIRNSLDILSESIGSPALPKKKMIKKWENILKQIATGDENAYKLAVIEADKTFDDMLKKIGYQGENMGQRMKNIKAGQISNIDNLWQAHKTRNNIVHDPDFHLTRAQAEQAVKFFEAALKELQVI